MAHGIDDKAASAKIETLFLAAHADGELGDDERKHFADVVAGFLGKALDEAGLSALLAGFEGDLARDGQDKRIAAIKETLATPAEREEALRLAVKLMATDGIVRTSERELVLELATALDIDVDRAADMVREVQLTVVGLPVVPSQRGRAAPRSVRVSLTDRCDLACVYCRPHKQDGYADDPMDDAAFEVVMRGLFAAGVRRVRVTGGEPLLFPRVVERVAMLARIGFDDLALTTNATRLEALAVPLREAGLRRLTVSLDTLDADRFSAMTRGGRLDRVLAGIDAAVGAGFDELKLNAVVVRGWNDGEAEALVRFAWSRGITPRFIEVMRIGEGANLPEDAVVSRDELRARLTGLLSDDVPLADVDRGPARYVLASDGSGRRVGFISGTSDTFCEGCDRLRVSSEGMLRPCLATNDGVSARSAAVVGDVDGVRRDLAAAWEQKPDGTTWKGCTEDTAKGVSIRAIGG